MHGIAYLGTKVKQILLENWQVEHFVYLHSTYCTYLYYTEIQANIYVLVTITSSTNIIRVI